MENESYKKLYFHAFNRLTVLAEEVERTQVELEEMYLELQELSDDNTEIADTATA